MFKHYPNESALEEAIARAFEELAGHAPDSDEYKKIVDRVSQLYSLQKTTADFQIQQTQANTDYEKAQRTSDREDLDSEADRTLKNLEAEEKKKLLKRRWPVSSDTTALIAANLIGIAIIVGYERAHVLTSKGMSFIRMAK